MYSLLITLLFLTAPATANTPADCAEIAVVLKDAVEEGWLSINEANEIIARCARAPDL